jgi:hypothetical protein
MRKKRRVMSAVHPRKIEHEYAKHGARRLLNRDHNLRKSEQHRSLYVVGVRPLAWIAEVLLVLCAVSIVTMPLTQYLWTWDNFMHGGQDFEFGALMVLTLLCLALVLPRHCKQYVQVLFACKGHDFHDLVRVALREIFAAVEFLTTYLRPSPASGAYENPLQI